MLGLISPGSAKADVEWGGNYFLFKLRSIMLGMFYRFSVYFNTYSAWSAFSR